LVPFPPPQSLAKGKIEPLMVHVVSRMRRILKIYLEPFGILLFGMEYFQN
jgi:hypothetical protein